jgi:hypothetical protein
MNRIRNISSISNSHQSERGRPEQDETELPEYSNSAQNQPPMADQTETVVQIREPSKDPPEYSRDQRPGYRQVEARPEVVARAGSDQRRQEKWDCCDWTRIICLIILCVGTIVGIMLGVWQHVKYLTDHAESDTRGLNTFRELRAYKVYGQCYDGCGEDSRDLICSFNACQKTKVKANGTICDGNVIWTWAHRYPSECLIPVGGQFKEEVLKDLKNSYKLFYALAPLAVLAGLLVAFLGLKIWPCSSKRSSAQPSDAAPEAGLRTDRGRRWSFSRSFSWFSIIALVYLATPIKAFPCWGKSNGFDQFFTNKRGISGTIHGWTSDCITQSYACEQNCTWKTGRHGSRNRTCMEGQCNKSVEILKPKDYVNIVLERVEDCGFHKANYDPFSRIRIANPLLEMNKFVTIEVNQLNVSGVTDPSVECLWNIGNH